MTNKIKEISLSELILKRLKELNITKKDLIYRMGYENINKGLNKLEKFLKGTIPNENLHKPMA